MLVMVFAARRRRNSARRLHCLKTLYIVNEISYNSPLDLVVLKKKKLFIYNSNYSHLSYISHQYIRCRLQQLTRLQPPLQTVLSQPVPLQSPANMAKCR